MKAIHEGPLTFSESKADNGLDNALNSSRADTLRQVEKAGLRGRGGAGFPTAMKWNFAAAAKAEQKYIVCNADEGEPGTFKDRVILSQYPDLVIEGMTIGGYVIGATKGIIYLRGEYVYLLDRLTECLERRRAANKLGNNINGRTGFDFDVEIRLGAGAYVCGEETALIESIEGHRGEARNRPPFPVNTGFMGQPTAVNNVETLAWVAVILDKGAEWFNQHGTSKSTGLKLFSISGDCEKPGVYEFPMGVTINELLKEVGGEDASSVIVGGASGTCVPREDFERQVCFEDVPTGGAILVFGPTRDMLDVAENFLEFFCDESCGQCTPCREGNPQLLKGLRAYKEGRITPRQLADLKGLGQTLRVASKCGLGQSSPNVLLSVLEQHEKQTSNGHIGAVTADTLEGARND